MTHSALDINAGAAISPLRRAASAIVLGTCSERRFDARAAVNTLVMRPLVRLIVVCAILVAPTALAATTAAPMIRVAPGHNLGITGVGFAPKALVRIRVVGAGIDRRASVRANAHGAFMFRFAALGRCSVDEVIATTAAGARARVPAAWFVRECPPPPPLAPGVYSA
jgi:hypothetical protein